MEQKQEIRADIPNMEVNQFPEPKSQDGREVKNEAQPKVRISRIIKRRKAEEIEPQERKNTLDDALKKISKKRRTPKKDESDSDKDVLNLNYSPIIDERKCNSEMPQKEGKFFITDWEWKVINKMKEYHKSNIEITKQQKQELIRRKLQQIQNLISDYMNSN